MAFRQLHCPCCQNLDVIQQGMTAQGKQRYRGKHRRCTGQTFLDQYSHHGRRPEVKQLTAWVFPAITADAPAIDALYVRGGVTFSLDGSSPTLRSSTGCR
jgi:pyruvate-formate lyase-activating enzyme